MRRSVEKIGYDIGGVIMGGRNAIQVDGEDTSFFSDGYLETPAAEGAFEAIARLTSRRFGPQGSYMVSKCGKNTQRKSLEWFAHNRFYDRTGIEPDKVHFCRKRHEKALICRDLGITVFIDDRLEVLGHMVGIVPTLLLFKPDPEEVAKFPRLQSAVTVVSSWDEVVRLLS